MIDIQLSLKVLTSKKIKGGHVKILLTKYSHWFWLILFFIIGTVSSNAQTGINLIGSFEQELPSYWNKVGEPTGAALSWATDQSRSMGRSLKIAKTGTGEEAYWESENMCDLWAPLHNKDVDIFLGAYVKTEGVNTNPADDDSKWWINYTFYGQAGNLIGELKLPIDQSVSSSTGWLADTNAVGSAIFPEDSYTTIIKFVAGKNATGTVWADDFMFYGRGGAWAGQDWNTQVGVPTGWFYWLPPVGGNDGVLSAGYENTKITDEEAYSGKYSLKFENLEGTRDGFVGTKKYLIGDDIKVGDVLRISVWLKGKDLDPAHVAEVGDQAAFSITPMFHNTYGNNAGFGDFWASDIPLKFPAAASFDWQQFYVDVTVQEGATALSIRLHPLGQFKGTVYCDLLEVKKIDLVDVKTNEEIPNQYSLSQNYPNPFNPTTIINFTLPEQSSVSLKIYDVLGREVRTLLNSEQAPGAYRVAWDGKNNFGTKVASGTYIYRIKAGDFIQSRKMILLK